MSARLAISAASVKPIYRVDSADVVAGVTSAVPFEGERAVVLEMHRVRAQESPHLRVKDLACT